MLLCKEFFSLVNAPAKRSVKPALQMVPSRNDGDKAHRTAKVSVPSSTIASDAAEKV